MAADVAPDSVPDEAPLRVGLLLCDHLDDDIRARVGDYTELFPDVFAPVGLDLVTYDATRGELPSDTAECAGWIVSGSRRSVYEDEQWIRQLQYFVRRVVEDRQRLVGVCFWQHMTAQELGGKVVAAEAGWGVGVRRFRVVEPAPLMDPVDGFNILMSQRDGVTRLPDGRQVIATAEYRYHIGKAGAMAAEPISVFGRPFRASRTEPFGSADWNVILRAFADVADVSCADADPASETEDTLTSIGAGIEARLKQNLTLRLDYGYTLSGVGDGVLRRADPHDSRVHFMATLLF